MTSKASSSATVHKIYLILLRRSKAFQWRQNRFEILQHIKISGEGQWRIQGSGPSPPNFLMKMRPEEPKKIFWETGPPSLSQGLDEPPVPLTEGLDPPLRGSIYPPLVPWWGTWFCVYVRGLNGSLKLWRGCGWFCMRLHFFIKASFIIDTKGFYCVTKGNISFSSLLFCFTSAAFLLWVLLLIAIFLSKLCDQALSINRFLKSEILPWRSLFVGFSRLLVCQIHFNNCWVIRGENVCTGRFPFKMRLYVYVNDIAFSHFSLNVVS